MTLTDALLAALVAVIGIIAVPVGKLIKVYLDKATLKAEAEIQKIENEKLRGVADSLYTRAKDVFTDAVERVNQEIVTDLKDKATTGKLSDIDKREVYDKAVEIGKDMLGKDYVALYDLLKANKANPDEYVRTLIEAAIAASKKTETTIIRVPVNDTECLRE